MRKHCKYSTTSTAGSCITLFCRTEPKAEHKNYKGSKFRKVKAVNIRAGNLRYIFRLWCKDISLCSKEKLRQFHQCKEHFTTQLGSQGKSWPRFQTECTNFSQSYVRIWWKSDCHEKKNKSFYIKITVLWRPAVAMPRSVLTSRVSWLTGVYIYFFNFQAKNKFHPLVLEILAMFRKMLTWQQHNRERKTFTISRTMYKQHNIQISLISNT